MYFISAPFGNYLKFKNAISVTGSWTLERRTGRLKQIVKTLRPTQGGWINKLGLRNPGIHTGVQKHKPDEILSLAHIEGDDWHNMYDIVPKDASVEINISCPNTGKWPPKKFAQEYPLWTGFSKWTEDKREWCICKIPPTYSEREIESVLMSGYTQIHASNTIRTEKGGLSGRAIIPYTLKILKFIKTKYPSVTVIAGGGIYTKDTINMYKDHGADHFSLGTVCFTPWKIRDLIND